ncbi:hypothetical protein B1964_01960 [Gordonia sp. i37]|nr:hypothetical protein B1964_01960 [Gordonia sp. i37]
MNDGCSSCGSGDGSTSGAGAGAGAGAGSGAGAGAGAGDTAAGGDCGVYCESPPVPPLPFMVALSPLPLVLLLAGGS